MADGYTVIRLKESRKVPVSITPKTGTETIASVRVTLTRSGSLVAVTDVDSLLIVQNVNGGWDTAAAAKVQAWYILAPVVLALTAGLYSLAFVITDSQGNVYEPVAGIVVRADTG